MDWGRAKSVLIAAFLLLNLLLGYQLWLDVRERLDTGADRAELPQETLLLMKQKGIRNEMSGGIPAETPELGEISFRYTELPDDGGGIALKEPVDTKAVFTGKELQDKLGGIIPELDRYAYDQAASGKDKLGRDTFVFYRLEGRYPIFDVPLELYYSNQKITAYRQHRVADIAPAKADDSKGQPIISADKAINRLVSDYLQAGAVIVDIRLGYHGRTINNEVPFASPTWRVLLGDGTRYYFNAISGDVESGKDGSQRG